MPEADLSYLAGLFDGEGCVSVTKREDSRGRSLPAFRVQISNTHRRLVEPFKEYYGGQIEATRRRKSHHRTRWRWRLLNIGDIVTFAEDLVDYCQTKRPQLQAVLIAAQTYSEKRLALSDKDSYIRRLCAEKVRQANQGLWNNLELGEGHDA